MACQCVVAEPTDYRAEDGFELPIRHSMRMFGGYKEKGNINTPLESAIQNQTDRFSLAIDAIDRMPRFQVTGAGVREALLNQQIAAKSHAHEFGVTQLTERSGTFPGTL